MTEETETDKEPDEIPVASDEGYEKALVVTTESEPGDSDRETESTPIMMDVPTDGEVEPRLSTTNPPQGYVSPIFFNRPDQETLEWLLPLWQAYGCKSGFTIIEDEWKGEIGFAGLAAKLAKAHQQGLLYAFNPLYEGTTDETGKRVPQVRQVELGAGAIRTLEEGLDAQKALNKPKRKARTQVTIDVDGVKKGVELRSTMGQLFSESEE